MSTISNLKLVWKVVYGKKEVRGRFQVPDATSMRASVNPEYKQFQKLIHHRGKRVPTRIRTC